MVRSAASDKTPPKRLTLDLAPEVHRALKIRAVDLDVPMSELLRALIEQALSKPSTLSMLADDLRRSERDEGGPDRSRPPA